MNLSMRPPSRPGPFTRASAARLLLTAGAAALLAACGGEGAGDAAPAGAPAQTAAGETTPGALKPTGAARQDDQSAAINAWFEEKFEQDLARSPVSQTFLGRKTDYDKWDDVSEAFEAQTHALKVAALADMRETFSPENLDPAARLSYRLFEYSVERDIEQFAFRDHWYAFSAFRGYHTLIPSFMINQHQVSSAGDAEAYIARLEGVRDYLGQHRANAERQFEKDIYPPRWSYDKMIATARNVIAGAPFDDGEAPSALLADFDGKLAALDIDDGQRQALRDRAVSALLTSVKPAYEELIAMFERHEQAAGDEDGAWKLPDGEAYYAMRLKRMTTTDITAQEVHELGLAQVARIHGEMTQIKDAVGFDGTLKEFFVYMREDPEGRFTYPNTDEGRERYLAEATAYIDAMRGRLDELFYTKPKAALIVKRVEPFREKTAGKAFYQRPAADGSRPGIYYANLYNMADMPIYQMEALAYHEGVPGHHMQLAIAQELEDVPSFRKFGGYTAYTEGWGLYSEAFPKEMGLYEDPYSDFGRLAMELWRACRLVVDSGIHAKKWTREEAIDYLLENTPNPEGDVVKAIERYIVMPGQATAYTIGMLKILELRDRGREVLGEDFDIRGFHDVILKDGAVPLATLEDNVDAWIAREKARRGS